MKLENFRVGNLILHDWIDRNGIKQEIIEIHGIVKNMGVIVDSNRLPEYETIPIDQIKPIKITREMLPNLGFFKIDEENDDRYYHYKKHNFKIQVHGLECVHEMHLYYNKMFFGFRELHRLQNLFYYFTQEELVESSDSLQIINKQLSNASKPIVNKDEITQIVNQIYFRTITTDQAIENLISFIGDNGKRNSEFPKPPKDRILPEDGKGIAIPKNH